MNILESPLALIALAIVLVLAVVLVAWFAATLYVRFDTHRNQFDFYEQHFQIPVPKADSHWKKRRARDIRLGLAQAVLLRRKKMGAKARR